MVEIPNDIYCAECDKEVTHSARRWDSQNEAWYCSDCWFPRNIDLIDKLLDES